MTVNELRIGNFIFDAGDEQMAYKVEQIVRQYGGHYYIIYRDGSITHRAESDLLEPIPLTPEILEKCGFQNISNDKYWLGESYFFKDGRLYYFPFDCPNTGHADEIPPYLHWLQNHHFFTFKKELEINL